ncbi:MAG: alpha/beta hydrolase [Proteobacteria bacterium]|nr:alpha/beta hydrolase [Pseudomonadota bacterium]MBU1740283.1 alpha/beta hydrolase [Pseudomonadota bacterium]
MLPRKRNVFRPRQLSKRALRRWWITAGIVIVASLAIMAFAFYRYPVDMYLMFKGRTLKNAGYSRVQAEAEFGRFWYYRRLPSRSKDAFTTKIPLILVHGLGMTAEYWAPTAHHFLDRPVVAPDLIGFFSSPAKPGVPVTLKLFHRQIEWLQRRFGWKKVILVGVSLGGWVATGYALKNPDRVAGLIVIGAAGLSVNAQANQERVLRLLRDFDFKNEAQLRAMLEKYFFTKKKRPPFVPGFVLRAILRRKLNSQYSSFLANTLRQGQKTWIGARTRNLKMPAVVIWGKRDKVFPVSVARHQARIIPKVKLIELKDMGHVYISRDAGRTIKALLSGIKFINHHHGRSAGAGRGLIPFLGDWGLPADVQAPTGG